MKRDDVTIEIVKNPATLQYLNRETGEMVSHAQMAAAGGNDREEIDVHREPPLFPYFERILQQTPSTVRWGKRCFMQVPDTQMEYVTTVSVDITGFRFAKNARTNAHLLKSVS